MRRMRRARHDFQIDRAIAFLLRDLGLTQRPVLVVHALKDQDGNADISEIFRDIPVAEFRIEPGGVPAVEGVVDVLVPARELCLQVGGLKGGLDVCNRLHRDVLDDEMRRDQHEAVQAMILMRAGIDRRDRGAVGMAEQQAAPEADRVEDLRQHVQGLALHVVERARQRDRARLAIACTRIGKDAGGGCLLQLFREVTPEADGAEAFVQHDDGGCIGGLRRQPFVFEAGVADAEEAGGSESHFFVRPSPSSCPGLTRASTSLLNRGRAWMAETLCSRRASHFCPAMTTCCQFVPSRSLNRWILPVAVFGSESTTSIQRGYFHGPIFCLTWSLSISCRPVVVAPGRSTTKAFGFSRPSGSASGTTAASSTAGCVISALSTSKGETQMPETLNMSSARPQKV